MKLSLASLVMLGVTLTTGGVVPATQTNSTQKQNIQIEMALNSQKANPVEVTSRQREKFFELALDTSKEKPLVTKRAGLVYVQPGLSNEQIAAIAAVEAAKAAAQAQAKASRQTAYQKQGASRTYSGSNYPYWDLLVKYASMYGVNPSLMGRVMMAESGGNPFARNRYSGAAGLFQFLPSTWRSWGVGNPYDAESNICAAAKLMAARGTSPWNSSAFAWR
jgi:soluble lytic murein transglycosylase-like protein